MFASGATEGQITHHSLATTRTRHTVIRQRTDPKPSRGPHPRADEVFPFRKTGPASSRFQSLIAGLQRRTRSSYPPAERCNEIQPTDGIRNTVARLLGGESL